MKIIKLIKYYPIVLNAYILIIMSLYTIGFNFNICKYLYTFIGQSFIYNAILLYFSFKFKFCVWHRLLIYNMSFCLLLETIFNFGICINNYSYIVIISTIISIFIAILIFRRNVTYSQKKSDNGI